MRFFELGIGTVNPNRYSNMAWKPDYTVGASLYGWRDFFPNSYIFGADIDASIMIRTDKIKTYICDQLDPLSIKKMWDEQELIEDFDIIIDDGYHDLFANQTFFDNSIHKLKPGGFYIIEDLHTPVLASYYDMLENWQKKHNNMYFKIISHEKLSHNSVQNNNLLFCYKYT